MGAEVAAFGSLHPAVGLIEVLCLHDFKASGVLELFLKLVESSGLGLVVGVSASGPHTVPVVEESFDGV